MKTLDMKTRNMKTRNMKMMLRTRFTIAIAAAVAITTLGVAAVAFLLIRADLDDQLKQQLANQVSTAVRRISHLHGHDLHIWIPAQPGQFGNTQTYMHVVSSGAAADGYAQATLGGVRALILTTPFGHGQVLQLAVPMATVDAAVAKVGVILASLSAVGAALAALAGWAVARAGLAPVTKLAAVAEQVTLTGDPSRRVEAARPDELGRLAASFNTMLDALQRSLGAQRQLVSDVSHELRTPLTSMRVNAELLAATPDLPVAERQQILDRIVAQAAELGDLVATITAVARGEAPPVRHSMVALDELVAEAVAAARRDWPDTPFRTGTQPCRVPGDAARLRTAIRNLLDNAAKFSPPGRPVQVTLSSAGELTVRDHGPGIAPADLPFVFDRCYRAPSARAIPGSGLGLAIVRQVAEEHRAAITAGPAPGGGTVLRFYLHNGVITDVVSPVLAQHRSAAAT